MTQVSNRNRWCENVKGDNLNKQDIQRFLIMNMLNKTIKMFEYKNLPETMHSKDLELQLQLNGYAVIKNVDGKLYSFVGGLGGMPNPYYLPTIAVIANPALKYNATLEINEQCVVVLNDYLYQGLTPIMNMYSSLQSEALTTLRYSLINERIPAITQADNDTVAESSKEFFNKIIDGDEYDIVITKALLDGLKVFPFNVRSNIKDVIEANQYIKGSWLNELGINATFNMKREAINEAEACVNDDVLFPLIETMLECRKDGVKRINEMFGTNIEVTLSSVWYNHQHKDDLSLQILENEAQGVDTNNEETTEIEVNRNDI